DAARARRQVLPGDPGRPGRARPVLRPVHPHEHRQPPPRHPGPVHRAVEQRLRAHREDARRDQPVHRTHAARPLHRGHLPDLRLPERARRPVRQLRQPARPGRPDQPAQPDQRRDPAVRRDRAPAVRPAGVLEVAGLVARHPDALAAERPELQQAPRRRPQAAGDQPRPRLGRAHPARRLARPADEAVLRLVRRGDRLPVGVGRVGAPHRRPGRLEAVVVRPGRRGLLLHGQGQHHLPLGDVARDPARAQRRGRPRRRGRVVRPAEPAHRGRQFRVPDDERLEVLHQPRHRHLRRRLPARVRPRRPALLHRGGGPGEPGQRLHLGRVRPAHQLRAGQRVGQPGQPVGLAGVQERRGGARAHVAGPGRRGPAGAVPGGVRHRRRAPRALAVQAGHLRGDADRRRGQRVPVAPGAVEAQGRPGAPRHDPAHRPAGGAGREHPADAVPAARRAEGARGPRRHRGVGL
ncbi:MAG: Methionyl-tRNA synthetase, partial [uncultured Actinomycetospora sp.]